MFTVDSGFIGNFKLGDNINYNLEILARLYHCQKSGSAREHLLVAKPIIILIGSICEAVLHDIHLRMREYTIEGVAGISGAILSYVRGKKIDKFEVYIASAKKHELLGPKTDDIYESLDELRKLRNRVHIQNEKGHFEPDESKAFSLARQREAEKTLEVLLKTISVNHPRPGDVAGHVSDFQVPWDEHLA